MPSIIKKTYCQRCGKEVPLFGGQKIVGGYICTPCKKYLQTHVDARGLTFKQVTTETINEIEEEIRIQEEQARQKSKEDTRKLLRYAGIGFLVLLVVGSLSSTATGKNSVTTTEDSVDVSEPDNKEDLQVETVEEEQLADNDYQKLEVFHLDIRKMPSELVGKDIDDDTRTWIFNDENYMQVIRHNDIISTYSDVEADFPAMCDLIQEQSGISITESFFAKRSRDHYVYYGETTLNEKPYYVYGHLYGTKYGMDEVRFYTTKRFEDSTVRNFIEQIVSSTHIPVSNEMASSNNDNENQEASPSNIEADVQPVDGYNKVQSFFLFIKPEYTRGYLEQQATLFGLPHAFMYGGDNGGGDPTSGIVDVYIGVNTADVRLEWVAPTDYIVATFRHDKLTNYTFYIGGKQNRWVSVSADGGIHTRFTSRLTFDNPDFKFSSVAEALDYELSVEE